MTDIDKFIDPKNISDILEEIKNAPSMKDIYEIIEKVYPGWILMFLVKYSDDYNHIQRNWEYACKENKLNKGQIMIVDTLEFDDDHKLIQIFCEIYAKSGFMVRGKDELYPCEICDCAIPCEESYNIMKQKGLNVPEKWSNRCIKCQDK